MIVNTSQYYIRRLQQQGWEHHAHTHKWRVLYKLTIGRLIIRYHGFVYRYRHHMQRKPIVWYAGRNKGTLVVTGKPDFSRSLKWTRYELIGGQFKYTESED